MVGYLTFYPITVIVAAGDEEIDLSTDYDHNWWLILEQNSKRLTVVNIHLKLCYTPFMPRP